MGVGTARARVLRPIPRLPGGSIASDDHRSRAAAQGVREHRRRPGRLVPRKALSGGQKQRLSIALALIGPPRIAVLDELTTGLDPQARRNTWRLIQDVRERGVTIVLVTHSMEEAEHLCDRVALLDAGRVVALDTPNGSPSRRAGGSGSSSTRRLPSTSACSPTCRKWGSSSTAVSASS